MGSAHVNAESNAHIRLTNNSGGALAQGDFVVLNGISGVADEAIANGAIGSFHVEPGLELQTADLESGEDTFGTANADVFWNPTSGDFSDTETAGYYLVGQVKTVKTGGMVVFTKYANATLVVGT